MSDLYHDRLVLLEDRLHRLYLTLQDEQPFLVELRKRVAELRDFAREGLKAPEPRYETWLAHPGNLGAEPGATDQRGRSLEMGRWYVVDRIRGEVLAGPYVDEPKAAAAREKLEWATDPA